METTQEEEIVALLRECVQDLIALEAAYIGDCHLSDPRKPLKAFAAEHGLRPTEMADLRVRAVEHLREKLAAKSIYGLTDIM
jgi:hypothetical protein